MTNLPKVVNAKFVSERVKAEALEEEKLWYPYAGVERQPPNEVVNVESGEGRPDPDVPDNVEDRPGKPD